MPKVQPETEDYYVGLIRSMRAKRPYLTILEIREQLEKKHEIVLTREYVGKLYKRAHDDSLKAIKLENAYEMISPVVERLSAIRDVLWDLIADVKTSENTKVYAVKTLMDADKMMMDAIYNSGLLQRDLGKLEVDEFLHGHVTHEHYAEVAKTMQNFGLLSPNQRKVMDRILLPNANESAKAATIIGGDNKKPARKKVVRK